MRIRLSAKGFAVPVFIMLLLISHPLLAGAFGGPMGGQFAPLNPHASPRPVPMVQFADLSGKTWSLSDFRGKVVLLNIWASWCPPCIQEMPAFRQLQEQYGPQGFVVVAISEDDAGSTAATVDKISRFMQDSRLRGLNAYRDNNASAYSNLKIQGLPTSLVIDRNGMERARFVGAADWEGEHFKQWLSTLLAEPQKQ